MENIVKEQLSTVKERLKFYLNEKGITATDFCKKIGVSQGFIAGMRESIQPDKLKNIAINYPDLNVGWLMTGIGDTLLPGEQKTKEERKTNDNEVVLPKEVFEVIKNQSETILSQQRSLEFFQKKTIVNPALQEDGAECADAG